MNRGVLVDYHLAGWSVENEPQIRKNYSDIHRVGEPNVLANDSSDSELASFCLERGCDLMTCDKEAYAPMLKKRGVKFVQVYEYDTNKKSGQQIYIITPVTSMVEFRDRTKSLNQSGAFLQIHLINQLKKYGWELLSEYPIRISPFLDSPNNDADIKQKLKENVPIPATTFVRAVKNSMDNTTVKETSMDVLAGKHTYNQRTCHLCIESKKLNPAFVDWIFFSQTQQSNNFRLLVRSMFDPDIPLFHIPKVPEYPVNTNFGICMTPQESFDYPICDFGVALKNGRIGNEYYKSDKTTVDDAARQIMEGMYGHVVDTILQYVLRPSSNPSGDAVCFFPIVVTNANLFICKVDTNDINSQTGTIDKEPEYQKVDSLIYECPVPSIIRFPELSHAPVDPDQNIAIRKWHVLIFSPKGFDDFLEKIKNNGLFRLK